MYEYDYLVIGDLVTEKWLQKDQIKSIAIGKMYDLKYRSDLTPQSPNVRAVDSDDNSNVYEVVQKQEQTTNEHLVDMIATTDGLEALQIISNGLLTNIKANQTNLTQKTQIFDSWSDPIGATMMDELMVSEKERVAGGVFNGTTPDTNFYTTTLNANGTATIANSVLTLATTTDANSSAMVMYE